MLPMGVISWPSPPWDSPNGGSNTVPRSKVISAPVSETVSESPGTHRPKAAAVPDPGAAPRTGSHSLSNPSTTPLSFRKCSVPLGTRISSGMPSSTPVSAGLTT